ncbi:PfkB family carbohydrate kinase [Amycolatopsis sp. Poz14]|uniref:PfkB family carbohydrate kinase n=1 Tax=Amycolatopsis sp. Poz14 TaxID=1447705 RepID=UPI001EE8C732|nr:PfkB family carbohydrate kinase [Amycolatopsis sp. Poz14]MCG3757124.1 ribokinase [Amycolatopsis sp. Poz14]
MNGIVSVVGSLNIDHVVSVARHPAPGETVLGGRLRILPGGKGANQAAAAARAGATARMIGRVGDDPEGRRYLRGLRRRGVDTSAVLRTPGSVTGRAHVTLDHAGENSIVVIPGANDTLTADGVTAAAESIRTASVVLLQLESPPAAVARAAELAAEAGARLVLNASPAETLPDWLLQLADPVIVNEHEHRRLRVQPRSVCVTLGAAGAHWGEHSERPPRTAVVDTTGAGDAFAGTLAGLLAAGVSEQPALAAAVAAGAQATTWHGAQGWEFS